MEVATGVSISSKAHQMESMRTYLCVPIKGASTLSFLAGFSVAIVRLKFAKVCEVAGLKIFWVVLVAVRNQG